jgi:hypothetical protein
MIGPHRFHKNQELIRCRKEKVKIFLFPTRVLARSGSADPAFNNAISAKWHSDK